MNKCTLHKLVGIIFAAICFLSISFQTQAANKDKSVQPAKERLVLMPLRVSEDDKNLQGAMETALVEGLQQTYEVFSGEEVAQKAKEIFKKESNNLSHKDCDETRCLQGIAGHFQSELLAVANVTKQDGGYFLALSIRNIFDNKDVYSKSIPCEKCTSFQVIDKLKEISGGKVTASLQLPTPVPYQMDPELATWMEVVNGQRAGDYDYYLSKYPKGKFVAAAEGHIKNNAMLIEREKKAWDDAIQTGTEAGYQKYIKSYPKGQFTDQANKSIVDLKQDILHANATGPKPGSKFKDCSECPELVVIPAGSFDMGSEDGIGNEKPIHKVTIGRNFAMGVTEITRRQFANFVQDSRYDADYGCADWKVTRFSARMTNVEDMNWSNVTFEGSGLNQDDSHPVVCVNKADMKAYIKWISKKTGKSYRLPTEAEWEYSCLAGDQTNFCGSNNVKAVGWIDSNSEGATHPVAQKQANAFGLFDMTGNVAEMVADDFNYPNNYAGAPTDGSEWSSTMKTGSSVVRGGSWDYLKDFSRSFSRGLTLAQYRDNHTGFRIVRMLP